MLMLVANASRTSTVPLSLKDAGPKDQGSGGEGDMDGLARRVAQR